MRIAAVLGCVVPLLAGCATGTSLFNGKDLTGWVEVGSEGSWRVEDGVLKCSGEKPEGSYAWLSTAEKYGDYELTLEWRISPKGNSGVFLRAPDREGRTSMKGCEVQIRDDSLDENLGDVSGAVFSRIPAGGIYSKPVGEWNRYAIRFVGRRLTITLNGHVVSDTDIDTIESMRPIPAAGHLGLQNHGNAVEFRNIRVRLID